MKHSVCLIIVGIFLILPMYAQDMQLDLQPVASIRLHKNESVFIRQLRTEIQRFETQGGRPLTEPEVRQVLDAMVDERLFNQAMESGKYSIGATDINNFIQMQKTEIAAGMGRPSITDAEFAQIIRSQTRMEMPEFREEIKKQLFIRKYIEENNINPATRIRQPTDAEIRAFFLDNRAEMFVRPDTVEFSIVAVPFNDSASKARAQTQINELAAEIGRNSANFTIARNRGQSSNTYFNASEKAFLPRMNRQTQARMGLSNEFYDTAFSLRRGEVSNVIESPLGFQIIRIDEIYPHKNLELNDVFQLETGITVREFITSGLLQQNEQMFVMELTQELLAELRRGNSVRIEEAVFTRFLSEGRR